VTVVAASAAVADALSTAFYLLGPGAAADYIAAHPGTGAVFVERGPDESAPRLSAFGLGEQDFVAEVSRISGGEKLPVVFDSVGKDRLHHSEHLSQYPQEFAMSKTAVTSPELAPPVGERLFERSRDAGKSWTNVTKNMPGLPGKMTVDSLEPSKYAAGTCYVALDGHQVGVFDAQLYRTTDFGKTWTRITNGIASSPLSFTHVVREDPVRRGLLYAGTENGVFVSFDDGANWRTLQGNLPHTPVYWLTVQPQFNDLVAGTYGRGFWIMDDVTPLQSWKGGAAGANAILPVRNAYRFRAMMKRDTPKRPSPVATVRRRSWIVQGARSSAPASFCAADTRASRRAFALL